MWTPGWPLDLEEIEAFKAGAWEQSSADMHLAQVADSGVGYAGGGWIRQDGGRLAFELYGRRTPDTHDEIDALIRTAPGAPIPDSRLYSLTFRDRRGREWEASRVIPDTHTTSGSPGVIASGRVRQLRYVGHSPTSGHLMWMHLPGADLRIPQHVMAVTETRVGDRLASQGWTRNTWIVKAADRTFTFVRGEAGVDLTIESETAFESGYDTRVEEALWFTLARPVRWSMLYRASDGEVQVALRPLPGPVKGRIQPPLDPRDPDGHPDVARLFSSYLAFAIDEGDSGFYAPTSSQLLRVLRASASTIDDEAQALSNAVENTIGRHFKGLGVPHDSEIEALDAAIRCLRREDGELPPELESVRDRVAGVMASWRGFNAKTALRALVAQKVITEEERLAWELLRHPTAHGSFVTGPGKETSEPIEACDLVHRLLLRLIFTIIGYEGRYNDRAEPGWPVRDWPGEPVG